VHRFLNLSAPLVLIFVLWGAESGAVTNSGRILGRTSFLYSDPGFRTDQTGTPFEHVHSQGNHFAGEISEDGLTLTIEAQFAVQGTAKLGTNHLDRWVLSIYDEPKWVTFAGWSEVADGAIGTSRVTLYRGLSVRPGSAPS
jgi:hypothetical protein